jgi:hypothetical protein
MDDSRSEQFLPAYAASCPFQTKRRLTPADSAGAGNDTAGPIDSWRTGTERLERPPCERRGVVHAHAPDAQSPVLAVDCALAVRQGPSDSYFQEVRSAATENVRDMAQVPVGIVSDVHSEQSETFSLRMSRLEVGVKAVPLVCDEVPSRASRITFRDGVPAERRIPFQETVQHAPISVGNRTQQSINRHRHRTRPTTLRVGRIVQGHHDFLQGGAWRLVRPMGCKGGLLFRRRRASRACRTGGQEDHPQQGAAHPRPGLTDHRVFPLTTLCTSRLVEEFRVRVLNCMSDKLEGGGPASPFGPGRSSCGWSSVMIFEPRAPRQVQRSARFKH